MEYGTAKRDLLEIWVDIRIHPLRTFCILILIALAGIGIIAVSTFISAKVSQYANNGASTSVATTTQDWSNYQPIGEVGKTYINETVPLDGYSYSDDTFQNVTFTYDGNTPIQFTNNSVSGFVLKSSDIKINSAMELLYDFGLLPKKEFITPSVMSSNSSAGQ